MSPKTKTTIPDGWRLLEEGEVIHSRDKWLSPISGWLPVKH